jgi:hypothetical protein
MCKKIDTMNMCISKRPFNKDGWKCKAEFAYKLALGERRETSEMGVIHL